MIENTLLKNPVRIRKKCQMSKLKVQMKSKFQMAKEIFDFYSFDTNLTFELCHLDFHTII
jgi:hypothetical protein